MLGDGGGGEDGGDSRKRNCCLAGLILGGELSRTRTYLYHARHHLLSSYALTVHHHVNRLSNNVYYSFGELLEARHTAGRLVHRIWLARHVGLNAKVVP